MTDNDHSKSNKEENTGKKGRQVRVRSKALASSRASGSSSPSRSPARSSTSEVGPESTTNTSHQQSTGERAIPKSEAPSQSSQREGKQDPITTVDAVKGWFKGKGYPLEFRVARQFREFKYNCFMGSHLRGSDGTLREVDVTAHRAVIGTGKQKQRVGFLPSVIVECKYSKSHAWILLGREEDNSLIVDGFIPQTAATKVASPCRVGVDGEDEEKQLHVSHGIVSTEKSSRSDESRGRDVAFLAVDKVVDLSFATMRAADVGPGSNYYFRMCWPLVVVDGPLFRGWLNNDTGEMDVEEISTGHMLWTGRGEVCRVDVTTLVGLPEYIKALEQEVAAFMRFLTRFAEPLKATSGQSAAGTLSPPPSN